MEQVKSLQTSIFNNEDFNCINYNTMNGFTESELKGRSLLKSVLDQLQATDQKPTTDPMDRVDYYATTRYGSKQVYEIKTRNKFYKEMAIEENKYQALLSDKKDKKLDKAYYVNFVDNRAYFWNTDTIEKIGVIGTMYAPMSTYGYQKHIDKAVRYLDTDKADLAIINKDGIWYNLKTIKL